MFRSKYLLFYLSVTFVLNSCSTSRPVISQQGGEANAATYISNYKDLAISEMKRTGIPASITLAQGMIESDFGRSRLAREANNHFGIKCHDDWKGPTIKHNDDRRNECFRKYKRPEESFYDHSDFLTTGSRYSSLFELSRTDYKGWARGLKKAGYATNPDYANMLIRKIEENDLHNFDLDGYKENDRSGSLPVDKVKDTNIDNQYPAVEINSGNENIEVAERVPRILENNRIQYIIVKEGETKESLDKEFELLGWELPKYNELETGFIPVAGQLLYLQPKRDKAEPGKEIYTAGEGDTMYTISQKYGIKMKKLYEYNRMAEGEEPVAGNKIWLRTMKPVN